MRAIGFAIVLVWLLRPLCLLADDPPPEVAEVVAAMKKATAFYTAKLAVHGGYASSWRRDLSAGRAEHRESKTLISIQPPGTTTVGLALVKAYVATGDAQFLAAARAAGEAVVACQLASGGWEGDFDFAAEQAGRYWLHQQVLAGDTERGKRRSTSTLDDDKTQSALLFLLELSRLAECRDDAVLQEAVAFGLESLVAAQCPNGGWPQKFAGPADRTLPVSPAAYPSDWPRRWPDLPYAHFYTLNDGNLDRAVRLLLRAHELTGEARYLAAARKAGDFLILAQMPQPQRIWAQQYNEAMEPVWARKFEPPSVTAGESIGAMETLVELFLVTGDGRFREPLADALAWYDRSALPDGRYARFYELRTNKPLYFVKDSYELTDDDGNLPTHYGFKVDHGGRDVARIRELLGKTREQVLAERAPPTTEKAWTSRAKAAIGKVRGALESRNADGVWIKGEAIDAGEFTRHMASMARYVEAARHGGREFLKL
ncbi:MAG: pectate lyase, partial [Planctomycetia bacterium]